MKRNRDPPSRESFKLPDQFTNSVFEYQTLIVVRTQAQLPVLKTVKYEVSIYSFKIFKVGRPQLCEFVVMYRLENTMISHITELWVL